MLGTSSLVTLCFALTTDFYEENIFVLLTNRNDSSYDWVFSKKLFKLRDFLRINCFVTSFSGEESSGDESQGRKRELPSFLKEKSFKK